MQQPHEMMWLFGHELQRYFFPLKATDVAIIIMSDTRVNTTVLKNETISLVMGSSEESCAGTMSTRINVPKPTTLQTSPMYQTLHRGVCR